MRIGLFTDTYTPNINGVVSSVVTLQKGLEAEGHEVFIVTSHKGFIHSTREGNVFRMPGLELKWLYGYILSTPYHFTLKAEIEKLNLDVIHVHTEFGVGIFGRIVAKLLNLPVVYTYHTMYEDYTHYVNKFDLDSIEKISKKAFNSVSRFLCGSVAAIIAPSEKTKEALERYGVQRPIFVIPTGVDLENFKAENVSCDLKQKIRDQYGIDETTKLITYIGRVAPEKSISIVIEGIPYITNQNCKVMIVGGGPALEELREQAINMGVQNRIIFTDAVAREEVAAHYAISNAFVSASTTETQGMTFIESLASGLCVFARKDEVLDHLVIENETGYYFEDAQSFAAKVNQYLELEEKEKNRISQNAVQIVKKYNVNTFISDIHNVYLKAIREYEDCYIIRSVKTSHECMKLYLDSKRDEVEETLLINLDDYMLYNIKKDDYMEFFIFEILKDKERLLLANRMCIKKLQAKDRTRKEMYDFLIQQDKVVLSIKEINTLIEQLENKGYINDEAYMIMEINKLDTMLLGKKGILKKLVAKGIPYDEVEMHLVGLDDASELIKAEKKASKYMMSIKNKSVAHKRATIIEKLHRDGFANDICKEVANQLDFSEDILRESVSLQKVIEKAYKNYSKKYKGYELKKKVITYALHKGYVYDDIVCILDTKENCDE